MRDRETSLAERLTTAATATQARLLRARAGDPSTSPGFARQQEARRAAAMARDVRIAERKAARRAAEALAAAARAAATAAQRAAHDAEAKARDAALEAEHKAARDARYAARKARGK
ncbi:hypothetical protein FHP25_35165 [Vineibacter terrae]|uniref:Uncharacterized protein n=1 Tax=Vineibacter terrae TaxID=2586908 RepID=A0A5C8P8Y2_9HYPH|nr:DUF6481 family protein [Vineibacter terrae]TXL70269.1 hypothetical protein FHP25_35165 [Vineibacter terrae]